MLRIAFVLSVLGFGCTSHQCVHEGATHELGASFTASDGCNQCMCTEDGMSCTTMICHSGFNAR